MPLALYALTVGAFGIGVTEFVIMGLLLEVSRELNVTIAAAGLLISGYALGATIGAPVLTVLTARWLQNCCTKVFGMRQSDHMRRIADDLEGSRGTIGKAVHQCRRRGLVAFTGNDAHRNCNSIQSVVE